MKELTWLDAITKVLEVSEPPLHYTDITNKILDDKLRTSLGATPAATVCTLLNISVKQDKESPYVKVSRGVFHLKTKLNSISNPSETPAIDTTEEDDLTSIITSFGMFWKKDAIEWTPMPKLLGMQQIGAKIVNFSKQLGVYLLYDGREVIYVGRSTDRPLGRRLYEHTIDRLSVRWDRFSWFGFLPVNEEGSIEPMKETCLSYRVIPMLESILIESLEPRQNRKRGDDLSSAEYVQKIDPEIEKKRVKAAVDAALNRS